MTSPGINDLLSFINRIKSRTDEYANSDITLNFQEPSWPEFRKLSTCTPPQPDSIQVETIQQAHGMLPQYIRNYMNMESPTEMLLLRSLPGTGKTTAAVAVAEETASTGKRIAYAGPRHDFYQEVMKKARHPDWWYEWLPRQCGDEDKTETCRYTPSISQWLARGYQAIEFCKQICGWDYVNDRCPYHAQKKHSEPIIFIQHQHICLGHPLEFDCVIGDESPIGAFIREWRIPSRFILPPGMPKDAEFTHILYYTSLIAENVGSHMEGEELIEYLGGADKVISACSDFSIVPTENFVSPTIHDPKDIEDIPYAHIFEFASMLKREAEGCKIGRKYPHRIIISNEILTLLGRHPVNPRLPAPIVWLDATANQHIYQALFNRKAKVVNIAPELHGGIFQVYDRANGKGSLMQSNRKTKTSILTRRSDELSTIIKEIASQYRHPAVIGFQKYIEQADLNGVQSAHFYAARGTNAFEDCDAIIIAGTPQPNIYDIAKIAKCIFFERNDAFLFDRFYAKPVRYQFCDDDGLGREYPVTGFWDDDDLQAVLSVTREDEILQSAHRGRPVNHPVDIWLLANVPIAGLPPTKLLSMRQVMGAPEGVDLFKFEKFVDAMNTIAESSSGIVLRTDMLALGYDIHVIGKYFNLLPKDEWEDIKIKVAGADKPVNAKIQKSKCDLPINYIN